MQPRLDAAQHPILHRRQPFGAEDLEQLIGIPRSRCVGDLGGQRPDEVHRFGEEIVDERILVSRVRAAESDEQVERCGDPLHPDGGASHLNPFDRGSRSDLA